MNKRTRQQVYDKLNGKCGYCGKGITYKEMQVDHISPKWMGVDNSLTNLMPSCRRCNHYKRQKGLEAFREAMITLHERVKKIYITKVAIDYEIVKIIPFDGVFYFEKVAKI